MKKEINIETEAVKKMAFTIKIEEAVITAISVYFLSRYNLGFPVWIWVLLFFSPDISMLGYLISTSLGAYCYNLFHHKAVSLVVLGLGLLTQQCISLCWCITIRPLLIRPYDGLRPEIHR
jgi:hypothetical protein